MDSNGPRRFVVLNYLVKYKTGLQVAILNANYMSHRLKDHYKTLHKGKDGLVGILCKQPFSSSLPTGCPRVHHRRARLQEVRGCGGGRHRQEVDGLRLPRAHHELACGWRPHDRAHGVGEQRGAGQEQKLFLSTLSSNSDDFSPGSVMLSSR